MYRHGLGRTSGRLMAVEGHGGRMWGMHVYLGGGEARRSERTALGYGGVVEKRERDGTGEGRG